MRLRIQRLRTMPEAKLLPLPILIMLLALFTSQPAPQPDAAAAGFTVSGHVYYSSTAMAGVEVALANEPGTFTITTTTTDANGGYQFDMPNFGRYMLVARPPSNDLRSASAGLPVPLIPQSLKIDLFFTKGIPLVSPNASVVSTQFPEFRWQAAPREAVSWALTVTPSGLGRGGPIRRTVTTPGWTSLYPLCLGPYTWAVRGYDTDNRLVGISDSLRIEFEDGPPGAPIPLAPPCGITLLSMEAPLSWQSPAGAVQYQLQVAPLNNDGPSLNVTGGAEGSFTIAAPVLGQGNYFLLPDMTYLWRVRTATESGGLPDTSAAWNRWSLWWYFRTPRPSTGSIALSAPSDGSAVSSPTPTLAWEDQISSNFFYDIELSTDSGFNGGQGRQLAIHGGMSNPPNTYSIPSDSPLTERTTYYWRVRPRVQSDGRPLPWSATSRFCVVSCP